MWLSPEIVSRLLAPTHWRWPFVSPSISLEPPCRGSPSPRRPVLSAITRALISTAFVCMSRFFRGPFGSEFTGCSDGCTGRPSRGGAGVLQRCRCADGCRTLFRVRRTPIPIDYAGAVLRRGTDAAAARSLLDFLTSATASRCFRQCGFHRPRIGSNSKWSQRPRRTALLSRPPKEQVFCWSGAFCGFVREFCRPVYNLPLPSRRWRLLGDSSSVRFAADGVARSALIPVSLPGPACSPTGVFHVKGLRQRIVAQVFPFAPARLWLFLVFSSTRPGEFPGYVLVIDERTDKTIFYGPLTPAPNSGRTTKRSLT